MGFSEGGNNPLWGIEDKGSGWSETGKPPKGLNVQKLQERQGIEHQRNYKGRNVYIQSSNLASAWTGQIKQKHLLLWAVLLVDHT